MSGKNNQIVFTSAVWIIMSLWPSTNAANVQTDRQAYITHTHHLHTGMFPDPMLAGDGPNDLNVTASSLRLCIIKVYVRIMRILQIWDHISKQSFSYRDILPFLYTEKLIPNNFKLNQIRIVITTFPVELAQNGISFWCSNPSEECNYNLNLVYFNIIQNRIVCVVSACGISLDHKHQQLWADIIITYWIQYLDDWCILKPFIPQNACLYYK